MTLSFIAENKDLWSAKALNLVINYLTSWACKPKTVADLILTFAVPMLLRLFIRNNFYLKVLVVFVVSKSVLQVASILFLCLFNANYIWINFAIPCQVLIQYEVKTSCVIVKSWLMKDLPNPIPHWLREIRLLSLNFLNFKCLTAYWKEWH